MKRLLTVLISVILVFLPLNAQNTQTTEAAQQILEYKDEFKTTTSFEMGYKF